MGRAHTWQDSGDEDCEATMDMYIMSHDSLLRLACNLVSGPRNHYQAEALVIVKFLRLLWNDGLEMLDPMLSPLFSFMKTC